jgi:hypothetical protein
MPTVVQGPQTGVGCAVASSHRSQRRSCRRISKRSRNEIVGTTKRSTAAMPSAWLRRNVRQPCDGGPFAIEALRGACEAFGEIGDHLGHTQASFIITWGSPWPAPPTRLSHARPSSESSRRSRGSSPPLTRNERSTHSIACRMRTRRGSNLSPTRGKPMRSRETRRRRTGYQDKRTGRTLAPD